MGKVKLGVFGSGRGMAMIEQILGSEEAELVAVCDKFEPGLERVKKAAEDAGMKAPTCYTSFDEFIEHDMDGVVLANYAHEHVPYAIRVLESGRHVMSECLTCATMKEAVELIEAVERSGKIYMYAENYCYTPVRWEMRKRYRKGDIGELIYAEGEYLHDCSSVWPQITYGERDHWRNQSYSTFYCTHSIGPVISMTGLRPVKVSGFETQNASYMYKLGRVAPVLGIEMITFENGAVLRSAHGEVKHAGHWHYQLFGDLGMMKDMGDDKLLAYVEEAGKNGQGNKEEYTPAPIVAESAGSGHGGADYYTTYYFIKSILGDEEAKKSIIDVYSAVDMCIPGILAYRSICNNNCSVEVPNLRNVSERDAYRNDTFCTFKKIAGDMYVPNNIQGYEEIPDSVYEEVRRKWKNGEPG